MGAFHATFSRIPLSREIYDTSGQQRPGQVMSTFMATALGRAAIGRDSGATHPIPGRTRPPKRSYMAGLLDVKINGTTQKVRCSHGSGNPAGGSSGTCAPSSATNRTDDRIRTLEDKSIAWTQLAGVRPIERSSSRLTWRHSAPGQGTEVSSVARVTFTAVPLLVTHSEKDE
jgi:hypothetical protein